MRQRFKVFLLAVLTGALVGTATAAFLLGLDAVTHLHSEWPHLIWSLPVVGFAIGWVYCRYGQTVEQGSHLVIDAIHDPQKTIPLHMAPFIFIATLLTHFAGGSAGREGTAVQIGASLAESVARRARLDPEARRRLLMAGLGAGFAAALGAPWAGMIFGMEVLYVGRFRLHAWIECFIAAFVGYFTCVWLGAIHTPFNEVQIPAIEVETFLWVAMVGAMFGVTAQLFIFLTHRLQRLFSQQISYSPLRPLLGGTLLAILFYLEGTHRFTGLGLPAIQQALTETAAPEVPLFKGLFTAITLASGFKGGEFIPLVYIGTTLGSAVSTLLPLTPGFLGALGFVAVFAGAANTPIACTILAMEIFGLSLGPYAFLACMMSYFASGRKVGIYHSQR